MKMFSLKPMLLPKYAMVVVLMIGAWSAATALADDPNRYHWAGQDPYFEGWYFKVSEPETGRSHLFIYAVYNPSGDSPESCAFMMAGINSEEYDRLVQARYPLSDFFSSTTVFDTRIGSVIQARGDSEALHASGIVIDNGTTCSWEIDFAITDPWKRTMGWMSLLPDLQTYWHVGAMSARASGWVAWDGERYEFQDCPGYQEKNWGDEFPETWFWIQANDFDDPEACCLSVGGASMPIGPLDLDACGIGFRFRDRLYTFSYPQQPARISSHVGPGLWQVQASRGRHRIFIDAQCDPASLLNLLNPTVDGIEQWTWESTRGTVRVRLQERRAGRWRDLVDTESGLAGTEFGGRQWVGWE